MKLGVTITGIADVNRVLRDVAPREARNLMKATVYDLTKQLADSARDRAPSDGPPLTLKPAIKPKRQRGTRDKIQAAVVVERGKSAKADGYFWRFLEFGTKTGIPEYGFFLRTVQELRPQIDRLYLETFVRKLEARLVRERRRRGL